MILNNLTPIIQFTIFLLDLLILAMLAAVLKSRREKDRELEDINHKFAILARRISRYENALEGMKDRIYSQRREQK